jgi:SAM-dependent methyltransferase
MAADPVLEQNRAAWNAERYDALLRAYGSPAEEAARLVADPRHKLRRLLPHMGEVAGKRVLSVQGSDGRAGVAFALLGAEVTVIDFAEENRRFALELAAAAGVAIDYRLADSNEADRLGLAPFDWVVMELGILHYHRDLKRFFRVMAAVTRPGGGLLVNEFHPVERKLFQHGPGALRDYFESGLIAGDVPNPVRGGPSLGKCTYRAWTLGEIVTGVIRAGFRLETLEETPGWMAEPTIPGLFTLLAEREGKEALEA